MNVFHWISGMFENHKSNIKFLFQNVYLYSDFHYVFQSI